MVRLGNVIFRVRDYLFPVVLLGLGFGTRPHIAGGSMAVDHLVDLAGFLVALGFAASFAVAYLAYRLLTS